MAIYRSEPLEHSAASRAEGLRVAWGGVWSGFLAGAGVFLLLSTLGLAIGVSTASIGMPAEFDGGSLGTSAAIWSGFALLISLFFGGMIATRSSAVLDKASGMIEGLLVWVLSVIAIIYIAGSGIGMLSGAASGIFSGITQSAQNAVRSIDVEALASGDASRIAARLGDAGTVQLVASATGMPQAEARAALADIRRRVEAVQDDPQRALMRAREGLQALAAQAQERVEKAAAVAQPYASATIWTTLAAMVLSLLAAISGASVGRRQVASRLAEP